MQAVPSFMPVKKNDLDKEASAIAQQYHLK